MTSECRAERLPHPWQTPFMRAIVSHLPSTISVGDCTAYSEERGPVVGPGCVRVSSEPRIIWCVRKCLNRYVIYLSGHGWRIIRRAWSIATGQFAAEGCGKRHQWYHHQINSADWIAVLSNWRGFSMADSLRFQKNRHSSRPCARAKAPSR